MHHLHCKQFNQGNPSQPPLVLLHGFLGDCYDWQTLARALPNNMGCYALDLPGHGLSRAITLDPERGFSQCSQLISDTLAREGISRYILLGYSLGGRIAMHHASQRPNEIGALILESCHYGLSDDTQKQQRLQTDSVWSQRFATASLPEVLSDWYQQVVFASLSLAQRQSLVNKRSGISGVSVAKMLLATSLARQNVSIEVLLQHNFPSYYLLGQEDKKYKVVTRQFKQQFPDLTVYNFDYSGHNIHFEQPLDYAAKIKEIYQQFEMKLLQG